MKASEASLTILVVDDSTDNLRVLGEMLRNCGYRVRTATSGRHALASARTLPPNLVLLDVRMPDMDGFAVCRAFRADPALSHVPILFVSAVADAESKVEAFTCGGVDYITKPFQPEEVISRVETHLALHALREGLEARVRERTSELEAVAAERQRLTAIIELTSDVVATAHPDGWLSFLNRSGRALVGWPVGAGLRSKTLWDICSPGTRRIIRDEAIPAARREGLWMGEAALCSATGEEIPVSQVVMGHRSAEGNLEYLSTIARDISDRKRAEEELRTLAARLRQLAARMSDVAETERKRIARDIHDLVGQRLAALGIALDRMASRERKPALGQVPDSLLAEARLLLKETAEHVYGVIGDLRPAVLDDYGLCSAIRWEAERFSRRTGLRVSVAVTDLAPRLAGSTEIALFRAVQEALHNAAKHASASAVEVHVEADDRSVRIAVSDDGVGFRPHDVAPAGSAGGWGLLGLAERVELVGGVVRIDSTPGRGTTIHMEVPA